MRTAWTRSIAVGLVLLWTGGAVVGGERDLARARALFANAQRGIKLEASAAHMKLGIWCRDAGLPPQATAEFLRAVEVSEGQHPLAIKLVDIMRTWGDKFWKYVQKKPKAILDTYEKKARQVELDMQRQRMKLARDAIKADLLEEGYGEYGAVVRLTDLPLAFDANGQVLIEAGKIPADVSARMKAEAITIDGKLYLRDAFLALTPEVTEVFEADGERLRVRSAASAEQAKDVHAIATALLPVLEAETDGRPTRKMQLFVFKDRATYGTWCKAAGREGFAAASGLADGATFTAVVCAEDLPPESVRGMCLHELTHLYQYGVTPAVMPSWYAEGFAETFGGDGTFTWADGKLAAGGMMSAGRLAAIRADGAYLPLADLLKGNALKLLIAARAKGASFYTQSWAFLRWLRTAAPPDVTARFQRWEPVCRGAALGAEAGKPRQEDVLPSTAAFQQEFGADLGKLEAGFRAWLEQR